MTRNLGFEYLIHHYLEQAMNSRKKYYNWASPVQWGKCKFFFSDSSEKIWSVCSSRSRVINSMIYDCLRKKFSYCGFLCLEAFQIDGRDNCYTIIIVLYATTQLTFETILFSFVSSNIANRTDLHDFYFLHLETPVNNYLVNFKVTTIIAKIFIIR